MVGRSAQRRLSGRWTVLVAALALTGCGKDKGASGPFPKPALARFRSAKLEVGTFKPVAKPARYGAKECHEGTVSGLAVLLCKYADQAALARADAKRLTFVGRAVTGAQRVDGLEVLVVADPDKLDLRGKHIQRLLQAFKKKKAF